MTIVLVILGIAIVSVGIGSMIIISQLRKRHPEQWRQLGEMTAYGLMIDDWIRLMGFIYSGRIDTMEDSTLVKGGRLVKWGVSLMLVSLVFVAFYMLSLF